MRVEGERNGWYRQLLTCSQRRRAVHQREEYERRVDMDTEQ